MWGSGCGACPTCRGRLAEVGGGLWCERCRSAVPVVDGIAFFGERGRDPVAFATDDAPRFREGFVALSEARRRRGHREPYAWFRPFNESSRALEPLLPILEEALIGGGRILDLWNRTGWTGAWLAGLFPDVEVVSIWEGDTDQLGYGGFLEALPSAGRPDNLTLAFAHPGDPLPFVDDSFRVVHGLDTLHRYPEAALLDEVLRVGDADAVVVFPHIHLTNSEPDPWFERGCTQRHGREWGEFLDARLAGDRRRAWVMSEARAYTERASFAVRDERDTEHYNGLVLIADEAWEGRTLAAPPLPIDSSSATLFVNPLVDIDLTGGAVSVDDARPGSVVEYMTARHAVCVDRIGLAPDLTSRQLQLVVHARAGLTLGQIADRLDATVEGLREPVADLVDRGLAVVAEVAPATAASQRTYVDLRPEGDDFAALWDVLPARYGDGALLAADDGSIFTVEDVAVVTDGLRGWFADRGLVEGDAIALMAEPHPEYLMTIWAAWRAGLVVVPLPTRSTPAAVQAIRCEITPKAVFVDDRHRHRFRDDAVVVFDPVDLEAELAEEHFAVVVEPFLDAPPPPGADQGPDVAAAVLFTSGTTGEPKGVELTMRSLMHTSAGVADFAGLRHDDTLMSLSGFHTMSGLRNPSLVALRAGASVVVPGPDAQHGLGAAECVRRTGVSVLTAGPSFVSAIETQADRLPASRPLGALRLLLSTGSPLDPARAARFERSTGVRVGDYYGLTETGGFCAGSLPHAEADGSLGRALGAVVEVHVDGRRAAVGEVGEIRVSGPGIAGRYVGDAVMARHDGWIHTGDQGVVDERGTVRLLGRNDALLNNRVGERVSGAEIENAIRAHPGVASCTVATTAERGELRALVVAIPDAGREYLVADLRTRLHETLGPDKTPDRIDLVDRLPAP
ncbi:MAG: AMP-binding protein [Acidimicrobiales bacterium]|nr:AMP-binding protein [Acidimicrobiales bacterium]